MLDDAAIHEQPTRLSIEILAWDFQLAINLDYQPLAAAHYGRQPR
jgi:hypothetical protein